MKEDLSAFFQALARGEADPRRSKLAPLSDLAQDEVAMLRIQWPKLPLTTRRRLIERMTETAESDVTFDFTMAFRVALADEDAHVRTMAVDGLWEDEDPKLADVLVSMLSKDPSPEVRAAVASSLEHFAMLGELEELPRATSMKVKEALLAAVRNTGETSVVRYRALEAVSSMSGGDVDAEVDLAYHLDDPGALVAALYAMGRSGDDRWAPHVIAQLRNTDPAMRFEAARAAGELELADAIEPLIRMITDPDPEVKQAVLEALGNIGGPQAQMALEELAQSDDEATQSAASEALGELLFRGDPLCPIPLGLIDDETALEQEEEEDGQEPER